MKFRNYPSTTVDLTRMSEERERRGERAFFPTATCREVRRLKKNINYSPRNSPPKSPLPLVLSFFQTLAPSLLSLSTMEERQSQAASEEEFYEKIEAPKFVDFTKPDLPRPDDRYWFCLRVGQFFLLHFLVLLRFFSIRVVM